VPDPVELVARAIHEDYVRRKGGAGKGAAADPSLAVWENLPENLRDSNRAQAADIAGKLRAISCEIVPKTDPRPPVRELAPGEVEKLAKLEHDRWEAERRADGWVYGPTKDAASKQTPYLVPWEGLSEEVRDLDRDAVRAIPRLLDEAGFIAVRSSGSALP
jgi:hypothetical protein